MFRKLWFGIGSMLVVAMLAGSTMTSVAFAKGKDDSRAKEKPAIDVALLANYSYPAGQRSDYGQVTDVSMDKFSIVTKDGQEFTFRFDADTHFVDSQNKAVNESTLQVGQWVRVIATHVDRSWWDNTIDRMGHDAGMGVFRTARAENLMKHKIGSDADDSSTALSVMFSAAPAAPSSSTTP